MSNSNPGSFGQSVPSAVSAVWPPSESKAVEEMKGTDQEYSSALTQYNSSANSGGEDIELLAFQTVTGQIILHFLFNLCKIVFISNIPILWLVLDITCSINLKIHFSLPTTMFFELPQLWQSVPYGSSQVNVVRPSSRTCGSHQKSLSTSRARWNMSPSGTPSSSWGHPCKTTDYVLTIYNAADVDR